MIGRLKGVLVTKTPPQIVVDVGGVGYEVDVPMSTFYQLPETNQSVNLFIHMVVREDALLLFGFLTESERQFFRALLKISGVGSKMALALLSGLSLEEWVVAVSRQETHRLIQIPGVGKKTAERLLLELKDRLQHLPTVSAETGLSGHSTHSDILNALISLGYAEREVLSVVKGLDSQLSVSEGIRQALQSLSTGR